MGRGFAETDSAAEVATEIGWGARPTLMPGVASQSMFDNVPVPPATDVVTGRVPPTLAPVSPTTDSTELIVGVTTMRACWVFAVAPVRQHPILGRSVTSRVIAVEVTLGRVTAALGIEI